MRVLKRLLSLLLAGVALGAAETLLRLPPMPSAPTIDGRIGKEEWKTSSHQFGGVSLKSRMLALRKLEFYIGYDQTHIYFAHRSGLPVKPLALLDSDTVEFTLTAPNGKSVTVVFDSKGSSNLPKGASLVSTVEGNVTAASSEVRGIDALAGKGAAAESWESELAIPLAAFDVDRVEFNRPWALQMTRHFQNPAETALWHLPDEQHAAGTLIPVETGVAVSFDGMGGAWPGVMYSMAWRSENLTENAITVRNDIRITSIEAPHIVSKPLEIPAGQGGAYAFANEMMMGGIPRTLEAAIVNPADGTPWYHRTFAWDVRNGVNWTNPNQPVKFDIAVYPTFKTMKARVSCGNLAKVREMRAVQFRVLDQNGKVMEVRQANRRQRDFHLQWPLPSLPEGDYRLQAVITGKNGVQETKERTFAIRHFEWEGNELGKDRIIVPPFKPLQVKGANEVNALLTGYRAKDGFWEEILAQGENILAEPIRLFVNGEPLTSDSPRLAVAEPDRVELEFAARTGKLSLDIRHEYDYDGMCKVTLEFRPEGRFPFREMFLDIPLKAEYAKMFHAIGSTMRRNPSGFLPQTDGVVWRCTDGLKTEVRGFRPYIWFGEIYKGLAWFAESPLNWSIDPALPSQVMIREQGRVTLRVYLVNQPVLRHGPFSLVMGFQPTPVKPQPEHFRQLNGFLWGWNPDAPGERIVYQWFSKKVAMRHEAGLFTPPDNDYSWIDFMREGKAKDRAEVTAFAKAYMAKHNLSDENFLPRHPDKLLPSMLNGYELFRAPWRMRYINIRAMCPQWPIRDVYVDECNVQPWRPSKNYDDHYTCNPNEVYRDFLMWNLDRGTSIGWNGTYFDNINDIACYDPVLGPAIETGEEEYTPYCPIFSVRELIRRAAILMTRKNLLMAGRPAVMLHVTNVSVVPFNSFAAVALEWEAQFGSNVYPRRFPQHYVLSQTIGTQAGCVPVVIVQASRPNADESTRSLLATAFANDLMLMTEAVGLAKPDFFKRALNLVRNFGYASPDTKVIPGWRDDNPVRMDRKDVMATVVTRGDGETMLLIGNLGETTAVQVDVSRLGVFSSFQNAENGNFLGSGKQFHLELDDFGYAIVLLKK
ncbi:MAG: hypothetical protein IJJ33_14210 [Victivallales bacterium]|nr:hypothetical protein [Victivallales bacterium]